ncbi:serine/threonine-protein kinase [Leptolyngbya sp. FACHB-261]|uniref:serine/threonine protein kinase n=1 Tax=Leptolyngbya sp. FACHB-261 TaxID=2692806 RepID=UPI001684F4F0|nr:serine/threonine-protein kinase [Leptolyngbya sp. FACHB-261]MBD2101917.1 serine/threonine protein kinase [Leptolyngbya sp. FACHB-261]
MSSPQVSRCINPECRQPFPRPWEDRFCQSCGTTLRLNERYVPLQLLGEGGFALTYTVLDLQGQTERVLKVLTDSVPKALTLFQQEAEVLASIRHRGVPRVESDGYFVVKTPSQSLPCLVMEKIEGVTLQTVLKRHPQGCSPEQIIDWLLQATEILEVLHSRHIVHRDLKPANLMLRSQDGSLVVIDFGGVKQIMQTTSEHSAENQAASTRLYSLGYSPPEQVTGAAVRPQADFFALGRTMLHLLTGRFPTELEDVVTGGLDWQVRGKFDAPLVDLLEDMTRLDVRQRPTSATEIRQRLQPLQFFFSKPQPSIPNPHPSPSAPFPLPQPPPVAPATKPPRRAHEFLAQASRGLLKAARVVTDTGWSVLLGGFGGLAGGALGCLLAYAIPVGPRLINGVLALFQGQLGDPALLVGREVTPFLLAGIATAIGLTEAGGFQQRRRYLLSALTGGSGYLLGLLALHGLLALGLPGLALPSFTFIASLLLVLGLGLKRDALSYGALAAAGTTGFSSMLLLFPSFAGPFATAVGLWQSLLLQPDISALRFEEFLSVCSFFAVMGIALGLSLSLAHYLLLPLARQLK